MFFDKTILTGMQICGVHAVLVLHVTKGLHRSSQWHSSWGGVEMVMLTCLLGHKEKCTPQKASSTQQEEWGWERS